MSRFSSFTLLCQFFALGCVASVQAEYCGTRYNLRWYCYDGTYCCGFQDQTALCCRSSPFYTWWYFWLGIAIFFLFVSSVIACCRRQRARRNLQASTTRRIQSHVILQTQQQQPGGFVNPGMQSSVEPPPMYPASAPTYQFPPSQPPPVYQPDDYYNDVSKEVKENLNNVQS